MDEKQTALQPKRSGLAGLQANLKENLGLIIGFFALCILLSATTRSFLTWNNFFNILRQMSNNMYLACGMTLVIILGGIDLSVGSIIAVSGCLCAGFISFLGMPSFLAVILSMLAGIAIGVFDGLVVSTSTIPAFIVTLATMNIGRGIARVYTDSKTISVDDAFFNSIGTAYVGAIPIQVIYVVVIVAVTALILNRTQLGRHIYAVGGNLQAAKFSGINTKRVTFFVYVFSSVMASFAGIVLASRLFSGQPTAGEGDEMDAIAAVVLGGTSMAGGSGKISGTIMGVLIIGVLNNGMNLVGISSSWQYIVKGIVIMIAVYIDFFKKQNVK